MKSVVLSVAASFPSCPTWLQSANGCGGLNYSGSTTCDSGLSCVYFNDWYSQCLRVTTTASSSTRTSSSTRSSSTSTTSRSSSTTSRASSTSTTSTTSRASSSTTSSTPVATGFVKTDGQKFVLNGQRFNPVGSNAYWLAQLSTTALIQQALAEIAQAGTTVLRVWGWNDVTSPSGTYYQLWNGATPTINYGADGLQKFDTVVAAAKAAGIRLVVPLTNNWQDYGGMDRYITQIVGSGQPHSLFYTNTAIKTAFKNYVNVFVTRYKNEPTIFSWELANEPRCNGCNVSVVTEWAKEMSAYIKSIDSNHMVALGDEGFFNQPSSSSYPYQGGEGVDFTANMAISTLDYGTFHLYPIPWGVSSGYSTWGAQWINDHAAVQKSLNKPVIIEEYGVIASDRSSAYAAWWSAVETSGLAGDQYWQAATTASGSGYNDGYGISTTDSIFPALQAHFATLKART
ncbi:Mannan endo-1,4-beta-mannosidase A; AltName: Full=Endo-beta-1,4-mannanase A; Flags: Precursor [Serendipita indica DSM 11827]|nr:Mannan endo-1,4-beta-mannosidase A; AltName: Full=Endo-beta-1,4-mannanase A; Flags: Precursor [Serendipita indica DSM 11827]